ncbi:MAG: fibrobacter succinogenes major paralogous domain-containing protein, partial [Bacteroidales bacterium]
MAFLLSDCKKPERIIKISTLDVSAEDIGYHTVTIRGEIIDRGEESIKDHGIEIKKTDQPDIEYTALSLGQAGSEKVFTVFFHDVEPSTSYKYRAYAENNSQKVFGESKTFTSLSLQLPALSTKPVTDIGVNKAVSGGIITDNGGDMITARGICWSTQENPDIETNTGFTEDGTGAGTFTSGITGLDPATTYYVRAYATNSVGTSYGNQVSFTTYYSTVSDMDENEYFTVKIGDQEWMAENLRTSKYSDGSDIPTGLNETEWTNANSAAFAIQPHEHMENLNSDEEVLEAYGALYNGYAVETGKLCPDGWHVPTDEDWSELFNYLVDNFEEITMDNVGNYLKSCRQVDSPFEGYCNTQDHPRWDPNEDHHGYNYYNYSALPGGSRYFEDGFFVALGSDANFWSSTKNGDGLFNYNFSNGKGSVKQLSDDFGWGFSVRCLKGEAIQEGLPVLTTAVINDITSSTAVCGGEISDDGGFGITARGVVWATDENPTIETNTGFTEDGTGTGAFTSEITGLDPATTYYVRAYATNSVGTAYGNQVEFTTITLPTISTEPVINIDHQSAESGGNISDDGGSP